MPALIDSLTPSHLVDAFDQWNMGHIDHATYCRLEFIRLHESQLRGVAAGDLFDQPMVDSLMARCALAGLHLLFGQLEASHAISQSIEAPVGSYWHAIMHRLEGDYGNSKYWYRRAATHPLMEKLAEQYPGYPDRWVDQIASAQAAPGSTTPPVAPRASGEWRRLFDDCRQAAVGHVHRSGGTP